MQANQVSLKYIAVVSLKDVLVLSYPIPLIFTIVTYVVNVHKVKERENY